MREVRACREAFPEAYIKVIAYDADLRPPDERARASSSTARRSSTASSSSATRTATASSATASMHKREATGTVELGNQPMRGADPASNGS